MRNLIKLIALAMFSISAQAQISTLTKKEWIESLDKCTKECRALSLEIVQVLKNHYANSVINIYDDAKVTYLYLHSYTLSPLNANDNRDFINSIAKNRQINIVAPTLSAHHPDSTPLDYRKVTYEDWLTDAILALKISEKLGKNIVLHGFSLGGLLSIQLARMFPSSIHHLILTAPSLMITGNGDDIACAGRSGFVQSIVKSFVGHNPAYMDKYLEGACAVSEAILGVRDQYPIENQAPYATEGVSSHYLLREGRMGQIAKLAKSIQVPTVMIYSEKDNALDVESLAMFEKNLSKSTPIVFAQRQGILHINSILNYKALGQEIAAHTVILNKLKEHMSN